jgi:hypothetical protein
MADNSGWVWWVSNICISMWILFSVFVICESRVRRSEAATNWSWLSMEAAGTAALIASIFIALQLVPYIGDESIWFGSAAVAGPWYGFPYMAVTSGTSFTQRWYVAAAFDFATAIYCVVFIGVFSEWRLRRRQDAITRHAISWPTSAGLICATLALLWANGRAYPRFSDRASGWPLTAVYRSTGYGWNPMEFEAFGVTVLKWRLAFNICAALLILAHVWMISEFLIRRREARKT